MELLRKTEAEPLMWSSKVFWIFLLLGPVAAMFPYSWFVLNAISGSHSEGGAYVGLFLIFMAVPVLGASAVLMAIAAIIFRFWTKKALKVSDGKILRMPFRLFPFVLRGAASGFFTGCAAFAFPFLGENGFMIALGNSFSAAVCGGLCAFLNSPSFVEQKSECVG